MDKATETEQKLIKEAKKKARKDKSDNTIYTSYLNTENFILEQLYSPTHTTLPTRSTETKFILFNKKTNSIDYLDYFEWQGKTYCPIVDDLLLKDVILLPSAVEEYGETKDLIADITKFLQRYFEAPQFYEHFLPYIALFYWVYERFPFVPYIHFIGLTGTGKTTAQEVFGSICYKPIDASGAITMASIFRTASEWKGTLLLDEFEPNGPGYGEMLAFLKAGVGNKAVLRTEGEKKREVMAYMIKSPKIFTSERPISNAGLRSRMFVVQMNKNKRKIPLYRLNHFIHESQSLRNKLLLWRLRNLNNIDLTNIEYGFEELQAFDGRVQQVITPIYFLSTEKTKEKILEFATIQEEETKRERRESLEGQIFQVISDSYSMNVSLKQIATAINQDTARKAISEKKIANIVRQVLHFDIQRLGIDNVSTVMAAENENVYNDLLKYYGIEK